MKKVLLGFIVGVIFATAGTSFADQLSNIGKKVEGEAKVMMNGNEVSDAVIIDSKSYAPVRDIAESFGADVGYDQGVITIDTLNKEKTSDEIANINAEIKGREGLRFNIEKKMAEIQKEIDNMTSEDGLLSRIEHLQEAEPNRSENIRKDREDKIAYLKSSIDEKKEKLVDLQAQVDQINAEIAELESTL